jgi:hypothetical protein
VDNEPTPDSDALPLSVTPAVEAERMVLSAMLHGGAEAASEHLTPGDFYERRHAVLYNHILEIWADNREPTPAAVLKRLADRNELTRSTSVGYLHDLQALHASPLEIAHYARTVLDEADRRRTETLAIRLKQAAEISDADARQRKVAEILTDAVPGARDRDSWTPIDLTAYLDGTHVRPEPTVGIARQDGLRLLYPGKEHAVIGEMESGKSWFSLACVAAELHAGQHVVYIHFEEADPADSVERLLVLGVPAHHIRRGFRFVGPSTPVTPAQIGRLLDPAPSLVILDGQNEGMALHSQAIREEDGAAQFRKLLVKPWTDAGAAVLSCDHVVKDKEARGRYALGSIHKGNALNGSLILLENRDPFGRGQRGASGVYVVKDRPGHLRKHGQGTKTSGKSYLGQIVVDDTRRWRDALELAFLPPADDIPAEAKPKSPLGQWILDAIAAQPEQTVANREQLFALLRKAGYTLRTADVREALEDLIVAESLVEHLGKRNAKGYRIPPSTDTQLPSTPTQLALPDVDGE